MLCVVLKFMGVLFRARNVMITIALRYAKATYPSTAKNSKSLHMCVPAAKNNNPASNTMLTILQDVLTQNTSGLYPKAARVYVLHPKSELQTKSPCLKPIRQGELYFIIYDFDRYSH